MPTKKKSYRLSIESVNLIAIASKAAGCKPPEMVDRCIQAYLPIIRAAEQARLEVLKQALNSSESSESTILKIAVAAGKISVQSLEQTPPIEKPIGGKSRPTRNVLKRKGGQQ